MIKITLAPLAGVTDRAFRNICRCFGADFATTEMVSAKGLYYGDKKSSELMDISHDNGRAAIQLFGSEPEIMAFAVSEAVKRKPSSIDINMGCPMPKIVNNGDGSALMKDIKKAESVIKAAVNAGDVPISVKFRSGYDSQSINAVEFAQMCESAGASSICIHPRTREQLYTGTADYTIIAAVKNAVKIPVVGNGDIFTPKDAEKMLEQTGCDSISVARGALGNPFIFTQIKQYLGKGSFSQFTAEERLNAALSQAREMCEYKPERIAVPEMRKHMAWYIKGMYGAAKYKNRIFEAKTMAQITDIVNEMMNL
ncbi:MAG: tRNA dihydrouridine synthase DusB [Clostridiales bacterium]|nr:MAG: tRNA dihydrouridine synthase DusB [Clostridiales bacterium]